MSHDIQDLFKARANGYHTCRIPGMIATGSNAVIVTTEARPGKGGDYDFNDVLMRRSTNGGRTFAPLVKLIDHAAHGAGPVDNVVMIPDQESGRMVAVFHHDYARAFSLTSDDRGLTWQRGAIVCRHGDLVAGKPVINPKRPAETDQRRHPLCGRDDQRRVQGHRPPALRRPRPFLSGQVELRGRGLRPDPATGAMAPLRAPARIELDPAGWGAAMVRLTGVPRVSRLTVDRVALTRFLDD